jgi:hypothetical protein
MQTAVEKLSRENAWDDFRRAVSPLLHPPEKIHQCLLSASAATKPEDIGCTPSRLSRAFRHACEIRSRFTVLDLARLMGLLPEAADEIIEQWG